MQMEHSNLKRLHRSRGARRGQALVEFALVVILLIGIVMGIIEFSVFGRNSLTIANSAREGARTAALGRTVEQIRARVIETARPLTVTDANIQMTYSHLSGPYNTLGNRTAVAENNAAPDDLVRVNVEIQNRSITGAFGALFNRPIRTAVTMRRERITN